VEVLAGNSRDMTEERGEISLLIIDL